MSNLQRNLHRPTLFDTAISIFIKKWRMAKMWRKSELAIDLLRRSSIFKAKKTYDSLFTNTRLSLYIVATNH